MSLYDDFEPRRPKARPREREPQARRPPESPPKGSGQAPRLKVTVQRPDELAALAARLGLSKAAVVNLALAELAARYGVR
jgi:hypothetical protein